MTDIPGELAEDPRVRRLAAELCLRRTPRRDEAPAWLERSAAERGALPPAAVICDLGAVLYGAHPEGDEASGDAELRKALQAYEDRVLGALAHDRRAVALRDALARATPDEQITAVSLVASAVSDRLLGPAGHAVPQSVWRRLTRASPEALEALGYEVLRHDQALVDELTATYQALVGAARARASVIDDADVFMVEHVGALAELGQRVAVRQVAEAADAMVRRWPRRLEARRRREGSIATTMEDESTYPTGGFASVARASGVTNLVPSELIYMDTDRVRGSVDAFDVRYAEAALLHYVRDEGFIARPRRHLVIALDASLADARIKDPDVPFQRGVIVLGWLLAAIRELEKRLSREALHITVSFVGDASHTATAPEQQLSRILLRDWLDKGILTVETLTPDEIRGTVAQTIRTADTRVAWLGMLPAGLAEAFDDHDVPTASLPLEARTWDDWCREGARLVSSLL